MVEFTTTILKFDSKGEKTGWTYIEIPADVAQKLKPGNKKSFRVKGKLDNYSIKGVALLPMGGGDFIMAINTAMRKGIGKRHGAVLHVTLEPDKAPRILNPVFMECLAEETEGLRFFKTLAKSHQHYFSKWIADAKTESTKAKRIAQAINALIHKQGFSQIRRALKKQI